MDGAKRHAKIHGSSDHDTTVETTGHKDKHQDGGDDEVTVLGLKGQQIDVPYNAQIATINDADTNPHTLDLATPLGETRTIIAVLLWGNRTSGSDYVYLAPNEASNYTALPMQYGTAYIVVKAGTQRVKYLQGHASDVWKVYCGGYVVEA
jgi:hypothetical protein